jgi:hypothetical protein
MNKLHKECVLTMKRYSFKRFLPLAMVFVLLFAFGCGPVPAKDTAEETAEPVVIDAEPQADAASVDHSSLYAVNGTTETSDNESYASDTANVNTVLVENAGVLTMTSADINKTGDASGDTSGGQNAAIAVLSAGEMTLLDSNVTTNAIGGIGLFASGNGSILTIVNSAVYTSGAFSPALAAANGATVSMSGGTLATEGSDAPCILLSGGSILLEGVTLSAAGGEVLSVLSGENSFTLDQTIVATDPIFAEESSLLLRLQNGASFTGALGGMLPAKASVWLDATSKLAITAETYLSIYVNADAAHTNIQTNGFNLYYDSNAPENAYLGGQSFMLPGGGFLAPII